MINYASDDDHKGISNNIFPLETWKLILVILINLSPSHQRDGDDADHHTQEKPTSKTYPVSPVESKQSFQHTQSQ